MICDCFINKNHFCIFLFKNKEKILVYLGIYCSSNRTFGATKYLLKSFGVSEKEVKNLSYRDEGCLGNMVLKLNNDKVRRYPYKDYYPKIRSFFVPYRCTLCADHFAELADISFGDIHIPEFWNDKVGTTSVIARSERGMNLLSSAMNQGIIVLNKVDKELIIKSQKWGLIKKKRQITFRFSLLKFFGIRLPECDFTTLPISKTEKIKTLISTAILYIEIWIGKRAFLWPLIKYLNKTAEMFKK
ncbi:MAG: hypothetical protein E3K38_14030 [Candidatus Kuenenia stuttgartiensis]|nr:hypothetical protein [Candidatus Kuenenia stuttgartiensis]